MWAAQCYRLGEDQEGGPACGRLSVTGWEGTRRVAQRVGGSVLPAGRGPGGWPSVWAAVLPAGRGFES